MSKIIIAFVAITLIAVVVTFLIILTFIGVSLFTNNVSYAKYRAHPEKYYQEKFCNEIDGVSEIILNDMTRVDCIANGYAIEIDFANKWYEAIGQSLYYAMKTNMKPGIALIIESKRDCIYYKRMLQVIEEFDLPLELPGLDISRSLYTINGRC